MTTYGKPLPDPTFDTKPYWEATKKHELHIQKCSACGFLRFPPRPVCPKCQSMQAEWTRLSGKGTVYSYSVIGHAVGKGFQADVPYINVVVEPVELKGQRIPSNLTGCKPEDVKIGMAVEVYFDDVTPEITLPKFRPAGGR